MENHYSHSTIQQSGVAKTWCEKRHKTKSKLTLWWHKNGD